MNGKINISTCRKASSTAWALLVVVFLLLPACSNRPKGTLGAGQMANILTDLHKLDGTLAVQGIDRAPESAHYYEAILEKHRTTQAAFDSSLLWYTRNPKRFEKVYIKVVDNITNWEKEIAGGKYHPVDTGSVAGQPAFALTHLWDKPLQYRLTGDSARTGLDFEFENDSLLLGDVYILSCLQRIAPGDSAETRRAQLCINYLNGKTDTLSTALHNDIILRRITFYMHAKDTLRIRSVSGTLLSGSGYMGKQNVCIDSIFFVRRYDPLMQDSLRSLVETNDTTKIPASKVKRHEEDRDTTVQVAIGTVPRPNSYPDKSTRP